MPRVLASRHAGFSLIELTIVLVIVALLSGGLMLGLTSQQDLLLRKEADDQQALIREAILGFAMTYGRLPCPAQPALPSSAPAAGQERTPPCNGANQYGVVPWATLGLKETDPWGNRLTYFASEKFTQPVPAGSQASFSLITATPQDPGGVGNTATILANGGNVALELPVVIVSHGKESAGAWQSIGIQIAGASGEQQENADADLQFVAHTPTPDFDDQVSWISGHQLKSRLVAAGKLP